MTLPSPPLNLGTAQPMYLGKPGAMNKFRMPDSGYASSGSRGENVQQLASGGIAVTRRPKVKRTWTLPFSGLTPDSANLLTAYYAGTMGLGPYIFVDPAWRNVLGTDVSSMGANLQAVSGWATAITSTQTLAFDSATAAQFVESGVMDWTGATTASKLGVGSWVGGVLIPSVNEAPVYLSDQPSAVSIYGRTVTSTASVTLQGLGVTAAGSISVTGSSATATLSTAGWTRLTSFVASGTSGALYEIPLITCNTASAPVIQLCCADLQYGVSVAASNLLAWVLGYGSPRVVVVPGSNGAFPAVSRLIPFRDHALTLGEA